MRWIGMTVLVGAVFFFSVALVHAAEPSGKPKAGCGDSVSSTTVKIGVRIGVGSPQPSGSGPQAPQEEPTGSRPPSGPPPQRQPAK